MTQSSSAREPFYVEHAKRLNQQGDVEELLALIEHSPNAPWAVAAAEVLADSGDPRGVEALYRRLGAVGRGPFPDWRPFPGFDSGDWGTLASALARLEGPGSPWADELLAMLTEEDTPIGWDAGGILAEIGDRRAIPPIMDRLQGVNSEDEAQESKWWALASALAELDPVKGVDVLGAALSRTGSWSLAESIADQLREIGDPRAVPALISALELHHGEYGPAENSIALALDEFGTPKAKEALEAFDQSLELLRRRARRFSS